jgi:hypothetical protein
MQSCPCDRMRLKINDSGPVRFLLGRLMVCGRRSCFIRLKYRRRGSAVGTMKRVWVPHFDIPARLRVMI